MATEDLEWERSKISNQDMNLLKRLGFTKEKDALRFPREESYPKPPMEYRVSFVDHLIRGLSPPIHEFLRGLLFVYGLQLHQLTPNSILHVSIFITLCECFLGVQPNWALWKRIFCLRRNGSHGVAYNIGGVVICVRSDVDYFDVKFPDSVQGWRKRWLYVHEESSDSMEYNIAPFDGKAKILRRRSWDAEASEEEKLATEALMTRIRELQSTRGGEVEERAVVTDDNQGASRPESGVGDSHKSAASLEKETEAEVSSSTRSSLPAASPKGKRKRDEAIDSGASKATLFAGRNFGSLRCCSRQLVRDYLDFCTRTLSLVYGTMFPRNKMPETLPALMDKFRDAPRIHGFVRAQLAAGARFAMIMIKICYPKLDMGQIVPKCLAKMAKRRKNFSKYDDVVTPVAEDMMDELLRMDSEFFVKGSYADSTRAINNERLTIDNILGNP
ncbi:hypothetical protein QYE76_051358 [Lolium multiflorum]|uniref:Transposase (putative) gypsy type domain-containing protein n=1 Tax=Lolium multiflorum TaxID=4521 RepID=A0AAD8SSN2_LOLMU|nr:hypothetical protein QYE76_051358 [Lolium multiflorum]